MAISISSSIVACLKAFNEFIEEIQDSNKEEPEGLQVQTWQDELGRLRIWAANIGAHQTGQSSLDFRLRDSSHIRQQIIKLLDELPQRLRNVRDVIAEGEYEDVESLGGSSSEDEESHTEIQQIRKSVATIINCLFQMSILVRKPAQHDLLVGSRKADVAAFEPFDCSHVLNKFPKADKELVSCLGHAMTRRRQYLKYRERHAMKLKQGIDKVINVSHGEDGTATEVLSETVATNLHNWHIDLDDQVSESGFSQTSYAPTLMSGGNITIPAPPRASHGGEPFECPYCYYLIIAQNTRSWNRHVFNDLQPYVCTEIACITPDKLYATRHEWLHHLKTAHRRENSSQNVAGGQQESDTCALCGDIQNTEKSRDRHVARHLQELALFVLPQTYEDSNDGEHDNSSDSRSSLASSADDQLLYDLDEWTMYDRSNGSRIDALEGSHADATGSKDTIDTSPKPRNSDTNSNEGADRVGNEENDKLSPRIGTTRVPRSLVNWQAIVELGYPWKEENDFIVIPKALAKAHIDEIVIPMEERKIDGAKDHEVETDYVEEDLDQQGKQTAQPELEEELTKQEEELIDEARNAKRLKDEEALIKLAIEEYISKKLREEPKNKTEEEADKVFREKVRLGFGAAGYDKESIEKLLTMEEKNKDYGQKKTIDLTRPVYIKLHRKHLSPNTLDTYELPWEWDDRNSNYIIVKRWIPERDQEILFEHTRKMRKGRRLLEERLTPTIGELEEHRKHDSADLDWHSYSDESLGSQGDTGELKHGSRALPLKRYARRKKGTKEQSDKI